MTLKAKVMIEISKANQNWLLSLGYKECNDYAQIVVSSVQAQYNHHVRFESVARYIRQHKEKLNAPIVQL